MLGTKYSGRHSNACDDQLSLLTLVNHASATVRPLILKAVVTETDTKVHLARRRTLSALMVRIERQRMVTV